MVCIEDHLNREQSALLISLVQWTTSASRWRSWKRLDLPPEMPAYPVPETEANGRSSRQPPFPFVHFTLTDVLVTRALPLATPQSEMRSRRSRRIASSLRPPLHSTSLHSRTHRLVVQRWRRSSRPRSSFSSACCERSSGARTFAPVARATAAVPLLSSSVRVQ